MENYEKTSAVVRPKERAAGDWDVPGCPFFFFGDEAAAEYDLEKIRAAGAKIKAFFDQFKR
jgi:hypothetical protein